MGTDDGVLPDAPAAQDRRLGFNPDAVADRHRRRDELVAVQRDVAFEEMIVIAHHDVFRELAQVADIALSAAMAMLPGPT
ncbi:MAG: hypothetical protein WKF96_05495 [Solirubrobacteraceae bacterium]